MNKIPRPSYDDTAAILELSNNKRTKSHPDLRLSTRHILANYKQYIFADGNAFIIAPIKIPSTTGEHLKSHYASPTKELAHIKKMREKSKYLGCPMCGSMQSGTLDHILPKNTYPEFSVFSQNLVHACLCNTIRSETLMGAANERILHPYFDECLSERLIEANFEDLGPVPKITIKLSINTMHYNYPAIAFHVREVVLKSSILGYLGKQWGILIRKPSLVIRSLEATPKTLIDLENELIKEREKIDDAREGKNTWDSVFISGLLHPPVCQWIYHSMHKPGRLEDGPLA
ncbi:hypothetical protein [Pseudomonas cichorii]|uniref:hypothetical protein n=1 Tax=Pseudomonas cichorii TaxID=36746 RepID=UPI001C8A2178|nr:hypothetical protein [Pseudomonas cichorii]MBX8487744.1 hypothetical protein [Pseudomonas cichorii]